MAELTDIAAPTETTPGPAPAGAESKKGEVEVIDLTRPQQTISRRMAESKATAPHFYLRTEVDMSRAVELRNAWKNNAGDQAPSINDLVVKATAAALRHHPRANGAWRNGRVELYSRINIGIVVATDGSMAVPTIGDADRKSLPEIAAESRLLAERVRNGQITPPELAGGTFSISNLGMFGVRSFDAVINAGQAGILAVGEITPDGRMELSLSCDHRILFGADGAKFLAEIRANLEDPESLT